MRSSAPGHAANNPVSLNRTGEDAYTGPTSRTTMIELLWIGLALMALTLLDRASHSQRR